MSSASVSLRIMWSTRSSRAASRSSPTCSSLTEGRALRRKIMRQLLATIVSSHGRNGRAASKRGRARQTFSQVSCTTSSAIARSWTNVSAVRAAKGA